MTAVDTVTVHVADLVPSLVVTVISAFPSFTPVIVPVLSTVTISLSELVNVTVLSVASAGEMTAFSVFVWPTEIVSSFSSNTIPVTATGLFTTVTAHSSVFPFEDFAVIAVLPALTAVIFPFLSTVATEESPLVYVMVLSVAFSGRTLAVTV